MCADLPSSVTGVESRMFADCFNSGISSILSPSSAPNTFNAFAQEQNQAASTSGNNTSASTNETAAASTYNEMLNPRQIEYPTHLGFNDLHIEAILMLDYVSFFVKIILLKRVGGEHLIPILLGIFFRCGILHRHRLDLRIV